MDKSKKSQVLKLTLLAAILFITPLLSSSIRPTYLYFIINLLIIALGFEAGLLSSFSKPSEDKKPAAAAASFVISQATPHPDMENPTSENHEKAVTNECVEKKFEKSASEKIVVGGVKMRGNKVKKCPSMPSLFFIGGGGGGGGGENYEAEEFVEDDEYYEEEEEEEEVGHNNVTLSGQEKDQLFNRAEMFIGNFYKQLKMQREDSWKRLHDIYHKAF